MNIRFQQQTEELLSHTQRIEDAYSGQTTTFIR